MDNLTRSKWFRLWLLFAVALLVRIGIVWFTLRIHSAAWFFNQGSELALLGESLRSGHGLSSPFGGSTGPSAFLAPGYPAIVAVVFAFFHPYSEASAVVMMLLQALFGAATVAVMMLLAQRAFDIRTATVAGTIWALAPPLPWMPTLFWETSLSILLATGIAAFALHCAESPSTPAWLGAGVLAALAISVNPSLLPIPVCCSGWTIYRTRALSWTMPAPGLALFLLLSLPWIVRNERQLHAFIPLRSSMGYELWQGNRPGSNGFFSPELHLNANAEEVGRYRQMGEVAYMHEKGMLAENAVRANPIQFLLLTVRRIFYFWTGTMEKPAALIVTYVSLTSLAGMAGLFLLWRRNRNLATFFLLPLLAFPLPYYITHPDFRFRLVIDPLLTILASYAVTQATRVNQLTR